MKIYEIILVGLVLSLDAFAVTISNVTANKDLKKDKIIMMPVMYALFQGAMPLIGYYCGKLISGFISKYSGYISFAIFFALATKMLVDVIIDAKKKDKTETEETKSSGLTYKVLILQAVATSIDALAVGITLVTASVNVFVAIAIIMAITAVMIVVALFIGKFLGNVLGNKATVIGVVILYGVAIKTLVEIFV